MKSKLIRVLSLILVFTMVVAMTACGEDGDDPGRKRTRNKNSDNNSSNIMSQGITGSDNLSSQVSHEVAYGNIVTLADIQEYRKTTTNAYKGVDAIQLGGEDRYLIIDDPHITRWYSSADNGHQLGYFEYTKTRMFPTCRVFEMDVNKDKIVVFSDERLTEQFNICEGKYYAVPMLFEDDGEFYAVDNDHVFEESMISQNDSSIELKNRNVTDLKVNGDYVTDLVNSSNYSLGYSYLADKPNEYGYILLDSDSPLTFSCTVGTNLYEAQLNPGVLFDRTDTKTDPISYTITNDGYAEYDFASWYNSYPHNGEVGVMFGASVVIFK